MAVHTAVAALLVLAVVSVVLSGIDLVVDVRAASRAAKHSSGGAAPPAAAATAQNTAAVTAQVAELDTMTLACSSVAIDTVGLDHAPVRETEEFAGRVFGHHLGPCRSARALAIVNLAMYEALARVRGSRSFLLTVATAKHPASYAPGAVEAAARHALVALFPSHAARLEAHFAAHMTPGSAAATALGVAAAEAVLQWRAADGANHSEPQVGADYVASGAAGEWSPDPVSQKTVALGARWGELVAPFVLQSAAQFRTPAPPALASALYAMAYDEVKAVGGDNVTTPSVRSRDAQHMAIFFAYDGTPSLCAPPRLYNQLVAQLAAAHGVHGDALIRLMTAVNVAMADACLAAWDSKYAFKLWRPVTAIRRGAEDGNDATVGDAQWTPLGAPASNEGGVDFTPPFPSYPSGHAVFGGAVFELLRRVLPTGDATEFTFVSDETNGVTRDAAGVVRALEPRHFFSLSQAEEENGQSRMPLGIHFSFDKTAGIAQGRRVGDVAFHAFY
jgi:membrane-associated phospholipid phosphatase